MAEFGFDSNDSSGVKITRLHGRQVEHYGLCRPRLRAICRVQNVWSLVEASPSSNTGTDTSQIYEYKARNSIIPLSNLIGRRRNRTEPYLSFQNSLGGVADNKSFFSQYTLDDSKDAQPNSAPHDWSTQQRRYQNRSGARNNPSQWFEYDVTFTANEEPTPSQSLNAAAEDCELHQIAMEEETRLSCTLQILHVRVEDDCDYNMYTSVESFALVRMLMYLPLCLEMCIGHVELNATVHTGQLSESTIITSSKIIYISLLILHLKSQAPL